MHTVYKVRLYTLYASKRCADTDGAQEGGTRRVHQYPLRAVPPPAAAVPNSTQGCGQSVGLEAVEEPLLLLRVEPVREGRGDGQQQRVDQRDPLHDLPNQVRVAWARVHLSTLASLD